MIYQNNTFEYRMNLAAFRDLEEAHWILTGHDLDSNPWDYFEPDGSPMNYLKALRIRCGYSHGPWDSWEYAVYLILHSENDEQRETIW